MLNDALLYESYEIIRGEKIMAPSAGAYHNNVMGGLYIRIGLYVRTRRNGYVFTDSMDVHLPDGNLVKPDLTVIKSENAAIINWQKSINGTPDMVVEVLSRSTKNKDLTIKKDIYEANGVKGYWIVDPWAKSVAVYLLRDGKFQFEHEYFKCDADEWDSFDEEEKAAYKPEIKVSIFDDLFIKVDDIFSWGYDF
ncbi:MAG: Uma2 family endonuclease [Selenomonadaceae bacterium]|nr:Uma2 family endonuclease [Selenomonadaceae bacterium]